MIICKTGLYNSRGFYGVAWAFLFCVDIRNKWDSVDGWPSVRRAVQNPGAHGVPQRARAGSGDHCRVQEAEAGAGGAATELWGGGQTGKLRDDQLSHTLKYGSQISL